jgi:hypothetical protein
MPRIEGYRPNWRDGRRERQEPEFCSEETDAKQARMYVQQDCGCIAYIVCHVCCGLMTCSNPVTHTATGHLDASIMLWCKPHCEKLCAVANGGASWTPGMYRIDLSDVIEAAANKLYG